MKTISRLLNIWLLLTLTILVVQTTQAGGDRYPIFVDCPDREVVANHCDTFHVQVRAEVPGQSHPNRSNIRYHLIEGPGEVDERTGWWSWKWSESDSMSIYGSKGVTISASIGKGPQHTTPPDEYCRFRVRVVDQQPEVLVNGQPYHSVFFVSAPATHTFDLEVNDPDECDGDAIWIERVYPEPVGQFYIEGGKLIFRADAADDDNKLVVSLVNHGDVHGPSFQFVFDTRDDPVPVFEHCPDDLEIYNCDPIRQKLSAVDSELPSSIGITYELISGPGRLAMKQYWLLEASDVEPGQTYEVEIQARYGDFTTVGDENCRFQVVVHEQPVGVHPMGINCGDTVAVPAFVESLLGFRAYDIDCVPLSLRLASVSPTFEGSLSLRGRNKVGPISYKLLVRPDSLDLGKEFFLTIDGYAGNDWHRCELTLVVEEPEPYRISIETLDDVPQGEHTFVDVVMESGSIPFISFDFFISFPAEAVFPVGIEAGDAFFGENGSGWDFLDYYLGYGSTPPLGTIRVVGIEDAYDSRMPTFPLPDSLPATLFTIDFLVTNDRNWECQTVPLQFYWERCHNNFFRSVTTIDNFHSRNVYDLNGSLLPIPDSLPSFNGITDLCLGDPRGPKDHRLIDFQHGGIHIVCADSFDVAVGDINLNRVPYEVADLMIFTDYFLYGDTVLTLDPRAQRQTSNINLDDRYLTIEDFYWFVQVHRGEVNSSAPYDTTSPHPAFFRREADGTVSVATPDTLGAAWLVFDGVTNPFVMAPGMGKEYGYNDSTTRVLIYSLDGHSFPAGPLLGNVDAPLLEVQTCTYNGAKVEAIIDQVLGVDVDEEIVPTEFALMQNYPNPFNNSTVIQFDLPQASEVRLTVYNIIGQALFQRTRYYEPGRHDFVWDGRSSAGKEVAAGVYFYRLQAGSFTSTKKMLLLK